MQTNLGHISAKPNTEKDKQWSRCAACSKIEIKKLQNIEDTRFVLFKKEALKECTRIEIEY
jgi:hypothetical protein